MLTLYHLRISHFSEKVRWALDHKGLEYESRLLVPGYHIATVRRLAGTTTVPVLVDSDADQVIPDSTQILHYLDRIRPDPALFPHDAVEATTVAEVEDVLDTEWGPNARAFAYCRLLQTPGDLRRRWAEGLRWHQRVLLWFSMPLLSRALRRRRQLTPGMASDYRAASLSALARIDERLEMGGGEYLVGDTFTAADLTASALVAPFLNLEGTPWHSDEEPPPDLAEFRDEVAASATGKHAARIWSRHRR